MPFHTPANDYAPAGNGLTYLQTFQNGYNPNDYYHGQTPAMVALSGTPQTGPKGGYVPLPLIVQVAGVNGESLINAPVTFSVTSGGGLVRASQSQPLLSSLTVRTDFSGQAKAFFQLPNIAAQTCYVRAAAGGGNQPVFADFMETSDNGGGSSASPFRWAFGSSPEDLPNPLPYANPVIFPDGTTRPATLKSWVDTYYICHWNVPSRTDDLRHTILNSGYLENDKRPNTRLMYWRQQTPSLNERLIRQEWSVVNAGN